ncbi:MAG: HD-GYP domain-containing protein [Lachnospiraceae bacterium]|nr:HD-GYP domain-containing protein [Lachnospiraceae bacterium]
MGGEKIKRLPISEIAPGMITARDIYSRNDQLILNKDTVLGADSIAKLMFYAVGGIWIYEESQKEVEEDAYTATLRRSQDFEQFKQKYDTSVEEVKEVFERLVIGGEELDSQKLFGTIRDMVTDARSNVHIFNMLHCIREYDDLVFMHSINVALICNVFGDWLRLPEKEKDMLTTCGLLHDVGKLLVPPRILHKPGKLTEDEYTIAKLHPESGYELLKNTNVDERVLKVAMSHHERYDGTGYPKGIAGDDIDMFSCLVGIADVYDAMTSKRLYRGPLCPFDVIKIFEEDGMRQFNPEYLLPVLGKLVETYIHHTVRLSDDSRGEVIMINPFSLARPVVKIGNVFVDLAKRKDLKIEEVL